MAREEDRLARLSIKSPISGRMLTHRTQDLAGRFVPAGAPIARIGDCAKLKAEIPVSERLLSFLHRRVRGLAPAQGAVRPNSPRHHRQRSARRRAEAHRARRTERRQSPLSVAGELPERFIAVVAFDNASGDYIPGMTGPGRGGCLDDGPS